MKLFDTIEAVKFPEENMIFITRGGYLYYIYNPKYKWWRKHSNAGNDHLTVSNYPDVSREELVDAMKGVFPKKGNGFYAFMQFIPTMHQRYAGFAQRGLSTVYG